MSKCFDCQPKETHKCMPVPYFLLSDLPNTVIDAYILFDPASLTNMPHAFNTANPLKRTLQQAAGNLHREEFYLFSDSLANPAASCGECARCRGSRLLVEW
jgi:hypothetical protein